MQNPSAMAWCDEAAGPILYPHPFFLQPLLLSPCYANITVPFVIALVSISLLGELTQDTELTEKYPQKLSPLLPSSQLPKTASKVAKKQCQ